ncbi:hypothetical protein T06_13340 [Trichinella sp. T6]|nr:hypothetical protein T06_13340 [Trichinella sp. T6]
MSIPWAYTKIGTIQRRLAWPLRKDDTQIREAFQIFLISSYLYWENVFSRSLRQPRAAENLQLRHFPHRREAFCSISPGNRFQATTDV